MARRPSLSPQQPTGIAVDQAEATEARSTQAESNQALVAIETAVHFSGPLPHPKILAQYERVFPGSAERILTMAEQEAAHRQKIEARIMESACRSQDRGPVLGFTLALVVIGIGALLVFNGKETTGLVALVSALAAMVIPFVIGRRRQERESAKDHGKKDPSA